MKVYWTVHIKNFDEFIPYILKRYKNFKNNSDLSWFKSYYQESDYLYLLINVSDMTIEKNKYLLSYCHYNIVDKKWLDENNYQHMGEYHGRIDKLKKLDIISKL